MLRADTYFVDNALDSVREISGALGGTDIVYSSVSFTLGDFVENLVLLGSAANGNRNALANDLTGNDQLNRDKALCLRENHARLFKLGEAQPLAVGPIVD